MTSWSGSVIALHTCPAAACPMQPAEQLALREGRGIEGDRYLLGTGTYSSKPEEGRQITLFEVETLDALRRDYGIELSAAEHRRNVTVAGVPLNHLVGRRLRIAGILLEATRLSIPCRHIEEVTGKSIFKALMHRSGLNCKILAGGLVSIGDPLVPA